MRTKMLVTALAFSAVSPALAQAPTDKVRLEVTRTELQVIGQGLMELPYKTSASVMGDLQSQLTAFDRETAKVTADVKASAEKTPPPPQPVEDPAK